MLLSQVVGLSLALVLVAIRGEPLRSPSDLAWGAAAGLAGASALVGFYRALAVGRMGLVAPVAGVLGAAIPVVVGSILQGLPGTVQLAGIAVAMLSVFLVSRPDEEVGGREGLGLALVAGVGFGAFFVLIRGASSSAVLWPIVGARAASIAILLLFLLVQRTDRRPRARDLPLIGATGCLDTTGNLLYMLAAGAGTIAVSAVLSSLYPVVTVVLAWLVLGERVARVHAAGILAAAVAIGLIGAG